MPAADMLERAARVLVELMGDMPERIYFLLAFKDSDMASVRRKAVESLSTCLVSGSLSISVLPLWSSILVKNLGLM